MEDIMDHANETSNQTDIGYIPTSLYVTLTMLSVFSLFGVIGNALVLYVYVQKRDRLTSTFFIIVLAAIDFVTCLVIMPWTVYLEYMDFIIDSDIACKLYHFLVSSNIPFSVFIMVAIALDRYFCICHPFLQAMTMRRAQIISAVMGLYAAVLGSLVACMFGIYSYVRGMSTYPLNSTYSPATTDYNGSLELGSLPVLVNYCTKNDLIFSDKFINNYRSFHVAQYVTSLVCIVILYAMIYHMVHSRRVKRLKQSQNQALAMMPRTTTTFTADTEITNIHNGDHKRMYDEKSPCISKERSGSDHNEAGGVEQKPAQTEHDHTEENGPRSPDKTGGETVETDEKENKELLHISPQHTNQTGSRRRSDMPEAQPRKRSRRERLRAANIKTAIMLSVVTVVFVITYAPAFIMLCFPKIPASYGDTSYMKLFHYMYFANNVANPIIYSFMNPNFRADLKKIFTK